MRGIPYLVAVLCLCGLSRAQEGPDLWKLANEKRDMHRFSTLFDARDVQARLSNEQGLRDAIEWCRKTAVTKVYIESFRDGYQAEKAALQNAKERFAAAGIEPSGCITPTLVGKKSNGWNGIGCYTDQPTQERIQALFEFTAGIFDEIMIDDFWFTDCTCAECDAARKAKSATVGQKQYPVPADTWEAYHCELMVQVSRDRVLGAARRINPKVKIIIKYPQWYDNFHERGYEVLRETQDFDRMWVGTETRDYTDRRWGGTPQYEAYFIMRWLGGIGGEKCGGGWYDPFGTTPNTYIEQARQTVLGGARESMLFCYGALQRGTGPKNIEALRRNIPELFDVAAQVGKRKVIGVAAYKPANTQPQKKGRIFDFVGMMGVPLVPCHEFPEDAPAAFLSIHALKDPDLAAKLGRFINAGKPVLITDGLAARLGGSVDLKSPNVRILSVKGDPKSLLAISRAEVDSVRNHLLRAVKQELTAPNKVGLYLFGDGSWVVENFNDQPAEVQLNGSSFRIESRAWKCEWR